MGKPSIIELPTAHLPKDVTFDGVQKGGDISFYQFTDLRANSTGHPRTFYLDLETLVAEAVIKRVVEQRSEQ